VTIFNDKDQQKKALKGLKNATKFIRGELGKDLKLRYVPNIEFMIDEDLEHQYKLLKIITEIDDQQLNQDKLPTFFLTKFDKCAPQPNSLPISLHNVLTYVPFEQTTSNLTIGFTLWSKFIKLN